MTEKKLKLRLLPLMHEAAEYLAMGQLMRRNILTYKAPPRNEGYDLICIHPNPKKKTKVVKIQVKSRYQTDSDRSVLVSEKSFDAFDYLLIVFLNIGKYYDKACKNPEEGRTQVEFYTLPKAVAKRYWHKVKSGMNRVHTSKAPLNKYRDEAGFERIAKDLGIKYPNPAAR